MTALEQVQEMLVLRHVRGWSIRKLSQRYNVGWETADDICEEFEEKVPEVRVVEKPQHKYHNIIFEKVNLGKRYKDYLNEKQVHGLQFINKFK